MGGSGAKAAVFPGWPTEAGPTGWLWASGGCPSGGKEPTIMPPVNAHLRGCTACKRCCYNVTVSMKPSTRELAVMKFYSFELIVEKEPEDEGYLAYSPTLPGCVSNGRTIEEARRNIREAIQCHLETLQAQGQRIPQHENLVHVEELSVGLPS